MEYADVATAAAGLEQEGINPTVLRVRAQLGGGSLRDITPLLKRWKAARKGEAPPPDKLPEHIAKVIAAAIAQERVAATQTLQEEMDKITKERDELAEALAAKEDTTDETTTLLNAEREKTANLSGQIEGLKEYITRLEAELNAERERRITAERAQAAAEARLDEIRATIPKPTTTRKKPDR